MSLRNFASASDFSQSTSSISTLSIASDDLNYTIYPEGRGGKENSSFVLYWIYLSLIVRIIRLANYKFIFFIKLVINHIIHLYLMPHWNILRAPLK